MKLMTATFLKACSLSVALIGSTALVLAVSAPSAAYADKGNGNGGGKGNGGGNGNSGNSGNAGGNGGGKGNNGNAGGNGAKSERSASAKSAKSVKTAAEKKEKTGGAAGKLGASASKLGALNAAHASPKALANAAPTSRVGRIAAYRDAVLAGETLAAELAEKTLERDALTPPSRSIAEIEVAAATAETAANTTSATVAELEADLAAAGGSDPDIEAALSAARTADATAQATKAAVDAELAAAVEYQALSDEITALELQALDQPATERSLLEAAANKPVTDDVETAVKNLLGLETELELEAE